MYSANNYLSARTSEYTRKNIKDWYGEDCLDWASDAYRELDIPLSSLVSIHTFAKVTGRDLLRSGSKDFKKLVNEEYGPLFYKLFKKLLKETKQDKVSSNSNVQDFGLDISENTTWTVPQLELTSDYDSPLTETGSSYGYNDLSSSFDSYSNSINCLSPSFGGSSYGETPYSSYNGQSPSYGGVSPTFGVQPRSLDAYERDREADSRTPTYFTQPSILSGGSISYGNCEGTTDFNEINHDVSNSCFDNSYNENYGGYSSLLPDFNSLMIEDGLAAVSSNFDIDIDDLDASFTEETFSDLDQYIHSETVQANAEFEQLNDGQAKSTIEKKKKSSKSSLIGSDQGGSLEESMLKKITTGKRGNRVRHPQSWEFLVRLLMNPKSNPSLIKWEDKERGIFRLVQKEEIAKLWGKRSQKHKDEPLAYDNFARILRYHYKSKILLPVSDKHLVYKLGDKVLETLQDQGLLQI